MPGNARHHLTMGPTSTIAAGTAADLYHKVRLKTAKARVKFVDLIPDIAMTADGTNYCTITLTNATASTTIATRSWAATNSVAGTPETPTMGTGLALEVSDGDVLKLAVTHAGTGLAGRVRLVITLEELDA